MEELFVKKLFGEINLTWKKTIAFAIITGVYTAIMALLPITNDTSFSDITVNFEAWILFGIIIIMNSKSPKNSALKCFVFFLISQPLVYAVEVLFGPLTKDLAMYYYRTIWFPRTLLTLPGGFIAYYCKKQNVLGAVVLGIGNAIQALMGVYYAAQAVSNFPHHLLSCLVSIGSIFLMTFQIQKSKKCRIISLLIPLAMAIACIIRML